MQEQIELPPGFRFHPTDEELITHYLSNRVLDVHFSCLAIGEVDMNKTEPWELPWRAKLGEKEWYFFSARDKKYPTGLRTNRATAAGYWKATGKDKEIFRGRTIVGMKKTLVYYKGRAPKGVKSNWVTHEYRLEGKFSLDNLPKPTKNDWVISRVFQKTSGGKKVHISGLMRMNPSENELAPSTLPPLMDPSPYTTTRVKPDEPESSHVHCFSSPTINPQKIQENMITSINNPALASSSDPIDSLATGLLPWGQFPPIQGGLGFQFPGGSNTVQDPSILRAFFGSQGFKKEEMVSVSQETDHSSGLSNLEMGKKSFEVEDGPSVGPQGLSSMWSY